MSIAPYGVKLMGNWQFLHTAAEAGTLSRGYVSPGGTSVFHNPDTGEYLMVFHTRFVGRGEQHEVRVHQLYLNEDGWFVAAPQRYAHERLAAVDPNQVPGDYKLINHGKDITPTVKTSTLVTLHADGTITGNSSGTWTVSGDHFAELTLDATSYHGVFATQWDDDNQMWVLTFTALSSNGVAVWGSRVAAVPVNAAPVITRDPDSQTVLPGQAVTLSVGATATPAPTYQWFRNGTAISGATRSSYTIASATPTDAGSYTVAVTNGQGTVTSGAAVLTVPSRPAQIAVPDGDGSTAITNLSTRGIVSTGDNVLIAGFVIAGSGEKTLLIQVSGLTLRRFGITGEIGRPHMTLVQHTATADVTLAENSDWQLAGPTLPALAAQVGALTLTPSTDPAHGDAGMVVKLQPGAYTVVVSPDAQSATTDGIGLIELYDATPNSSSRLVNLSTRGRIETGARQLIVGVTVTGTGHSRLLIRGVGPTLQSFGVGDALTNPSQTLYQNVGGVQTVVATNDDWWNSAQADQIETVSHQVGAFALGPYAADAVILTRLQPGQYSAIISPPNDQPGVALAEIYEANGP
ncbi:MAG TPA: glycoside hydrolase family 43 C-terminal domain-containing protein [Opitutaceae bacterium]|nr:glycoside hydrolase family 43 C-terminal domain-containing protein [Opitutaceae bacterium]